MGILSNLFGNKKSVEKQVEFENNIKYKEEIPINPIHNRISLKEIRNLNNWEKGFDEGKPYWDKGERERKAQNFDKAIELFDLARYNGYNAPALYKSYTMVYRKLKDYDNEIAIIDEANERLNTEKVNINKMHLIKLHERRAKAVELKQKINHLLDSFN